VILPKGKWFWRIKLPELALYSDSRVLFVENVLPEPVFMTPKPNSQQWIYGDKSVEFSWQDINGADYYKLSIYKQKDGQKDVLVKQVTTKQTVENLVLPSDKYIATVQAFANNSENSVARTGLVATNDFSLRTPRSMQLVSPVHDSSIDGLTALQVHIIFILTELK